MRAGYQGAGFYALRLAPPNWDNNPRSDAIGEHRISGARIWDPMLRVHHQRDVLPCMKERTDEEKERVMGLPEGGRLDARKEA